MREETFSISQLLCCNTFWKIIFTWSNIIDYDLIYQRTVFENAGELKFSASWIEKSIKNIKTQPQNLQNDTSNFPKKSNDGILMQCQNAVFSVCQ